MTITDLDAVEHILDFNILTFSVLKQLGNNYDLGNPMDLKEGSENRR